ncbi:MAG: hypothetical protein MUC59_02225 [Saprospiraceae bacterium]|nr:hypothetical protein [Saprospiraceae bacterium]
MKIHPFLLSLSMMLLFFATGCQKQEDFTSADFAQETPLLLNDGDVNVSSFAECCALCKVEVTLSSDKSNNSATIRRGDGCVTFTSTTNSSPGIPKNGQISGSSTGNIKIKNNGVPEVSDNGTFILSGLIWGKVKLCSGASAFIDPTNPLQPGEERELPLVYDCLIPEPPGPEPDDKQ